MTVYLSRSTIRRHGPPIAASIPLPTGGSWRNRGLPIGNSFGELRCLRPAPNHCRGTAAGGSPAVAAAPAQRWTGADTHASAKPGEALRGGHPAPILAPVERQGDGKSIATSGPHRRQQQLATRRGSGLPSPPRASGSIVAVALAWRRPIGDQRHVDDRAPWRQPAPRRYRRRSSGRKH